jgi:hypothetical protein
MRDKVARAAKGAKQAIVSAVPGSFDDVLAAELPG